MATTYKDLAENREQAEALIRKRVEELFSMLRKKPDGHTRLVLVFEEMPKDKNSLLQVGRASPMGICNLVLEVLSHAPEAEQAVLDFLLTKRVQSSGVGS